MKQIITDFDYQLAFLLELMLLEAENKILFGKEDHNDGC